MRIPIQDFEGLRHILGWIPYHWKGEAYAAQTADDAFTVRHLLANGLVPNSVWGTAMGKGFVYYTEADRTLWTPNTTTQKGHVVVRCSAAKLRCEIHVTVFDDNGDVTNG